jgi:hypothetical protein
MNSVEEHNINYNIDFHEIKQVALAGVHRAFVFTQIAAGLDTNALASSDRMRPTATINLVGRDLTPDEQEAAITDFKRWSAANGLRELEEAMAEYILAIYHAVVLAPFHNKTLGDAAPRVNKNLQDMERDTNLGSRLQRLADALRTAWPEEASTLPLDEFKSVALARNCIAHHRSMVKPRHCNQDGGLALKWMSIVLEHHSDDGTIRIGKELFGVPLQAGSIKVRYTNREKTFPIGSVVDLDASDIAEIGLMMTFTSDNLLGLLLKHLRLMGIPEV